jgi:hypothetical protein
MSCHTEYISTAIVTISRIICWARVLILAGKNDAPVEEKRKDKKQSRMKFPGKKLVEMNRLGKGMKFLLPYFNDITTCL